MRKDKGRILSYKAGSVLLFSQGEYSDFSVCGEVVIIKDCELPELVRTYEQQWYDKSEEWERQWNSPEKDGLAGWMIANGWAMPLEASIVHLGNYSSFAPEFDIPNRSEEE